MKRILVVSHCILNTASKLAQNEEDLAEEFDGDFEGDFEDSLDE